MIEVLLKVDIACPDGNYKAGQTVSLNDGVAKGLLGAGLATPVKPAKAVEKAVVAPVETADVKPQARKRPVDPAFSTYMTNGERC